MYKIIGGDKKEYGPVSADDLRHWIAEGRLSPQSLIQAEGSSEWKPLAAFAEFSAQHGFHDQGTLIDAVPKLLQALPAVG